MSEAKHTKGPWHVDDLGEESFLEHNHRWGIGSPRLATYRLAKVEGMGEVSEANARLIAAAPTLLAACEAVLDAISGDLGGMVLWINPPHQAPGVHETAHERLMTAIKSAKGSQ